VDFGFRHIFAVAFGLAEISAMIIRSVIFMTAFLVDVQKARPETRTPVRANREAFATHKQFARDKLTGSIF
jgi:hypothetical protein